MVDHGLEAGRHGGDQVRGTKYEVRSEGARRNGVAQVETMNAKRDAWELNPRTREVGTLVACEAMKGSRMVPLSITHDATCHNTLITHVFPARHHSLPHTLSPSHPHCLNSHTAHATSCPSLLPYLTRHSPASPLRTSYFVPLVGFATSYFVLRTSYLLLGVCNPQDD